MPPLLPFARREFEGDTCYAVCPACQKRIALAEQKDFESFSGAEYRAHYVAEHHPAQRRKAER